MPQTVAYIWSFPGTFCFEVFIYFILTEINILNNIAFGFETLLEKIKIGEMLHSRTDLFLKYAS